MRYLIIPSDSAPFYSKWFEPENHGAEGLTVIDNVNHLYWRNNIWNEIETDHL